MSNLEAIKNYSLNEGVRIKWTYWHVIGKNGHCVKKRGAFIKYNPLATKAFVLLDGNTRASWKKLEDIEKIEGL